MILTEGDQVQVIAGDHPYFGKQGVVLGHTEVYYATGHVMYYFVDIGVDTISCTADQLIKRKPGRLFSDLQDFLIYECRELDRELALFGGYDYESIDLPPVTYAIDGVE